PDDRRADIRPGSPPSALLTKHVAATDVVVPFPLTFSCRAGVRRLRHVRWDRTVTTPRAWSPIRCRCQMDVRSARDAPLTLRGEQALRLRAGGADEGRRVPVGVLRQLLHV